MTVESDLFNELKGLVENRAFPDCAPFSTLRPYITYQQIGGEVINPISGGLPGKKNARMQINVWADSRLSAAMVASQVEDAVRLSTSFSAKPESALSSQYDEEVKIYGAQQDFSIWYTA